MLHTLSLSYNTKECTDIPISCERCLARLAKQILTKVFFPDAHISWRHCGERHHQWKTCKDIEATIPGAPWRTGSKHVDRRTCHTMRKDGLSTPQLLCRHFNCLLRKNKMRRSALQRSAKAQRYHIKESRLLNPFCMHVPACQSIHAAILEASNHRWYARQ